MNMKLRNYDSASQFNEFLVKILDLFSASIKTCIGDDKEH